MFELCANKFTYALLVLLYLFAFSSVARKANLWEKILKALKVDASDFIRDNKDVLLTMTQEGEELSEVNI